MAEEREREKRRSVRERASERASEQRSVARKRKCRGKRGRCCTVVENRRAKRQGGYYTYTRASFPSAVVERTSEERRETVSLIFPFLRKLLLARCKTVPEIVILSRISSSLFFLFQTFSREIVTRAIIHHLYLRVVVECRRRDEEEPLKARHREPGGRVRRKK